MENRLKRNKRVKPGEGQLVQRSRGGGWPPGSQEARFPVHFKLELTRLAGLDQDTSEAGVKDTSKHFDLRQ